MTATYTFDGTSLNDGTTYKVLAAGSAPLKVAPLRHSITPFAGLARSAVQLRPPGTGSITLAVLVKGSHTSGTLETNVDALLKVLIRPQRWLVASQLDTRRVLASVTAIELLSLTVSGAVFGVTFGFDAYWEPAAFSGSVQTGSLSSLVALGLETGNAYGHRLSLTPGGNAPTTPRVLLCVQSGSQTPTRFTLRAPFTSPPEMTSVSLSLAAGNAISFDPYLQRACSLSLTSVVGWWPLADAGGTLRDFSSGSRDLSHTSSYKTAVTADTPSAWWRFEELTGSTASDSYGANHGTYYNSPTLGVAGLISEAATYAVALNGTNQYITAPDAAALDLGDTYTIEMWLRRATLGTYQVLIDKGLNAYRLVFNATNKLELVKPGVATMVVSTTAIADTSAHHVVATKSGATIKLYIDGVDVTYIPANQTCTDNATTLYIGADVAAGNSYSGTLDEVALYNTALSAARVSAHYTAGTAADNVLYLQDGPLYGGVIPGWPACDFDGSAGEFYSSSASFSLTANISCGAWIYLDATGSIMGVLGKGTTNAGFWLGVTAAGLLTGGVGSGAATRSATGTTTLTTGRWYHAALVWDDTADTVTLYLDGEKEGYASGAALTVGGYSGNFTVGSAKDLSTTVRYWNGKIAEPWVASAALTQTQVRNVYQRGFVEYNPTLRDWLGAPWPQLHGESSTSTATYEIRVTHASAAPDIRAALAWRGKYVTA